MANYWTFRIANDHSQELMDQLKLGRLRQGWGKGKQDLRDSVKDKKVHRNLVIKDKVKKGDFLLVPHMPKYGLVTIAQATEDFSTGYIYDPRSMNCGHIGHVFPAEYVCEFSKKDIANVHLLSSLNHCRLRFFSITKYSTDINTLIVNHKLNK